MIKPQTYHICRRREIPREGSEGGGKKNRLGEKKERKGEREREKTECIEISLHPVAFEVVR